MPGNRQVIIASLPQGTLSASDYEVRDGDVPEPGPDEVRVRTLAVTIGAGQRAGLQGSASYAGAPVTGIVMPGTGVGRVEASNIDGVVPGDMVVGTTGWQDYAVLPRRDARVVDGEMDPALHLSIFGTNGLTAYFGLLDVGRPTAGDTVVVSAASGSVGHLAGQLAARRAAAWSVSPGPTRRAPGWSNSSGSTLSSTTGHRTFAMRSRRRPPTASTCTSTTPAVTSSARALRRMRPHGRIVCCGVVSQYDTDRPEPGPRGVPGLLVNNRVRMEGFLVFDYADRYDAARADLRARHDAGTIVSWHDEVHGLDEAPGAFVDLLGGGNVGTRIVRLAD